MKEKRSFRDMLGGSVREPASLFRVPESYGNLLKGGFANPPEPEVAKLQPNSAEHDSVLEMAVEGERGLSPDLSGVDPDFKFSPYDFQFQMSARRHGVDWMLVAAIANQESKFDPKAESNLKGPSIARAKGLMQLMDRTARSLGVKDSFSPQQNIEGGAKYLSDLMDKFSGAESEEQLKLVLASYNAGPSRIRRAQALAKSAGKDPLIWKNVRAGLGKMVKSGKVSKRVLKQVDTYVTKVLGYYRDYSSRF